MYISHTHNTRNHTNQPNHGCTYHTYTYTYHSHNITAKIWMYIPHTLTHIWMYILHTHIHMPRYG